MQENAIQESEAKLEAQALRRKAAVQRALALQHSYQVVGLTMIPSALGLLVGTQVIQTGPLPLGWDAWLIAVIAGGLFCVVAHARQHESDGIWVLCAFTFVLGLLLAPVAVKLSAFRPNLPLQGILSLCGAGVACVFMAQIVRRHGVGNFDMAILTLGASVMAALLLVIGGITLLSPQAHAGSLVLKQLWMLSIGPLLPIFMTVVLVCVIGHQLNRRAILKPGDGSMAAALYIYWWAFLALAATTAPNGLKWFAFLTFLAVMSLWHHVYWKEAGLAGQFVLDAFYDWLFGGWGKRQDGDRAPRKQPESSTRYRPPAASNVLRVAVIIIFGICVLAYMGIVALRLLTGGYSENGGPDQIFDFADNFGLLLKILTGF